MSTSKKIARLVRWSLIGVAVLMGGALVATVWSTNLGVESASDTLTRGQATVFFEGVRFRLRELGHPPTRDDLVEILAEYSDQGLRYVATFDEARMIEAEAGTPTGDRALLEGELMDPRFARPTPVGDRVRQVIARRFDGRRARRARGFRPTSFVIEFEPKLADELRRGSRRTLTIGALAAVALLVGAVVLLRWILRREALERQLEQNRRLASVGQMSAVLAHEIRNPLASLKGNAQLLVRSLPGDDKSQAKAKRIVSEAVRLEALTNNLLEFSRAGEIKRVNVDPAELLRETAGAIEPDRIQIDAAGTPSVWPLDPDRVRQVLSNLLENAVLAGEGPVSATATQENGRLVYEVTDRGPGITPANLELIFEPFFTTRTRGTGLGLAVSKRLVELHNGEISATNAERGGARFRIEIPRN